MACSISGSNSTGVSRSDDLGKKCAITDPNNWNSSTCIFCNKNVKEGAYRMKEHFIGALQRGKKNTTICPKCLAHVIKEVCTYIGKKEQMKVENLVSRLPTVNPDVGLDIEEVEEGNSLPLKRPKTKGLIDLYCAPVENKWKQTSMNEYVKKDLRKKSCKAIAKWFYDAGIPFHAVTHESFRDMVEMIGQFGPGLKPPTVYKLRVPLLKEEVEETIARVKEHDKEWAENGCSILSNGWRDLVVRKDIISFLVNSPKGPVFINSIDAFEVSKDSTLFKILNYKVEEICEENVVQVITDNASAYKRAETSLETERKHLYWTPCAVHCIDLMLEDIGKLPTVRTNLKDSMFMSGYIVSHVGRVNMIRSFTNQRNLHRPTQTRFTNSFITLSQIHQQKSNLRKKFTSEEWKQSTWAKELEARKVAQIMLRASYWKNVVHVLKLTSPLLKVLRNVDKEVKPAMGYIYEDMDRAKETIAKSFMKRSKSYKKLFEIIDQRWDCPCGGILLEPGVLL